MFPCGADAVAGLPVGDQGRAADKRHSAFAQVWTLGTPSMPKARARGEPIDGKSLTVEEFSLCLVKFAIGGKMSVADQLM